MTTEIDFNSLTSDINEFESQLSVLQKKYQAIIKDKLQDILKSFFDIDPECKAIVWTQYTPYFNDGEECIFGINEPNFYSFNYSQDEDDEDDYGAYDGDLLAAMRSDGDIYDYSIRNRRPATPVEITRGKLSSIIQAGGVRDILKLTFGDHAKITVTRDGITCEEYDHD